MNDINVRFKKLRECCNKSQEEFGKVLGLSRSGISEIESGRRNVTDKHVVMLKNWKEFNVNEDWLLTGTGGDDNMFIPDDMNFLYNIGQLGSEKNEFKKFYLNMMMNLPDEYWNYIYGEFKNFKNKNNE